MVEQAAGLGARVEQVTAEQTRRRRGGVVGVGMVVGITLLRAFGGSAVWDDSVQAEWQSGSQVGQRGQVSQVLGVGGDQGVLGRAGQHVEGDPVGTRCEEAVALGGAQ